MKSREREQILFLLLHNDSSEEAEEEKRKVVHNRFTLGIFALGKMNGIPFRISRETSNAIMARKRKALVGESNLFHNHHPGNLAKASNTTLPIITLSSLSYFKEKFIQMATKNKSMQSTSSTARDFRMAKIRSHIRSLNRANVPSLARSPLRYPTRNSHRSTNRQENTRCFYADKTPRLSRRTISARGRNHSIPALPPPPPLSPPPALLSQSHNQYGHFLAYLRRQSLARQRRKQQEEEGYTDHIETTVRLNLNKQTSSQLFQSTSHYSLASLNTDVSSMPIISMTARRAGRPSFSHRPEPRTMKIYQQTPPPISKTALDDPLLTSSSILITPRNSVADDETMPPIIIPYECHLNDDMLHYCSVNDRRHILATDV